MTPQARAQAISLIHFDLPQNLLADLGILPSDIAATCDKLEQVRGSWQDADTTPEFFGWPERLHGAYQSQREASELGRIFKIANGMHDEIDAVVVVGSSRSLAAIRVLVQACCDPLHNELNRAQRGSKPRIYFVGDRLDNDTLSSLLQRLKTPDRDSVPERYAVVAISDDGDGHTQSLVVEYLLEALESILGTESQDLLPRYFIPFARRGSWLHQLAVSVGCHELFEVDFDIADPSGALALANHLPAAMLGLDCMRLLGGAYEMNQHFLQEPFEQNTVMKYVAVNRLSSKARVSRSFGVGSDALEAWKSWCETNSPACPRNLSKQCSATGGSLDLNVIVQAPRTDQLEPSSRFVIDQSHGPSAPIASNKKAGHCVNLMVPEIDTFAMGQLFQMVMIAAQIETHLSEA